MDLEELRARQAPLKALYKEEPEAARTTLRVTGRLDPSAQTCTVDAGHGPVIRAGLHPAAGGEKRWACSGDMLLQSLAACAGVTLGAVATAMGLAVRGGIVMAEGDLDFRGTLGVSKDVPVGFTEVRLRFAVDADATDEQLATLLRLTERYCVIFQSLKTPPVLSATSVRATNGAT
jgi:uncharacterized OsmC-like protein